MKKITYFLLVLLMAALVCLSGCKDPNEDVLEFALAVTDEAQLQELEKYPNLQKLDLRGSDCYEAIEAYIASHPQVSVTYDVEVTEGVRYAPDVTELTFADGKYDYELLLENLPFLRNLKRLVLPQTSLTDEQLEAIETACPGLEVSYTLMFNGREMDPHLEQLNLADMSAAEISSLLPELRRFADLKNIYLMNEINESTLTPVEVKALMDALPGVTVHYTFELFGKTVSTTDERVEFVKTDIGNARLPEIRQALDILPNCTYFKLDRCGTSDKEMAKLREDYPNTKIVWRVYFASYNCLTDVEMLHCTSNLDDVNVEVLKYCNDVMYLDIGHNRKLSNLSFISYMPKLKIAIVVDCAARTLEPFGNCPDLEWLEIVNCYNISDLSPLANCTKLKGLNMSSVFKIQDLSPLYDLEHMERLYLGWNLLPEGQFEKACEELPNCWVTNTHQVEVEAGVSMNYAVGWRLDENKERAEWYKEIRKIFRYDENYYNHDD